MENKWESECWETCSVNGDSEVLSAFLLFSLDMLTLDGLFEKILQIPHKYEDADVSKETINKVFDHLIESFNLKESDVDNSYQTVTMKLYFSKTEEDIQSKQLTKTIK